MVPLGPPGATPVAARTDVVPHRVGQKWKCPNCGRGFARRNQAHSCQVVPLQTHLAKASPEVRKIYQAIIRALRTLGPFEAVPTKTGINLLSATSLGGVSLHKTYANLGLVLTRRVEDPRVVSVLQISPRSFAHRVKIEAVSGLDEVVRGWLKEAYQVGLMAGRRPG